MPVVLTVTSSGWDATASAAFVGGFVDGAQSGATCVLELTGPGAPVTVREPAEPGAATTTCAAQVPGTSLSPGSWTAVLSYESSTRSGRAPGVPITVP